MPSGHELVAKAMISRVVKSGAKKLSFSISLGQGSKGMISSLFVTSYLNFFESSLSTMATHPS